MIEIDRRSASLKRRIHRLLGNRIELVWIRGCDLDPVLGEPEWIEQAILEMALRARAAMPYGGRLVVESCNLDLDELSATAESLAAGRYVMFEMTCLRQTPTIDIDINVLPFSIEIDEDLWLNSQLTQALNILNAIGGTICEYNEPGRALTLRAFLPSAATVVYSDEVDFPMTQTSQPDTILLVEDEGHVREVACEILETAGYTVIVARSGTEAIDVFKQHGPFSLLVTDVVMPGMNGRDLADKLLSLQPGLKTIYMSGFTDSPLLRQDFQSSKYIYLQKPFTLESLTQKVKEVLSTAVM